MWEHIEAVELQLDNLAKEALKAAEYSSSRPCWFILG